MRGPEYISDSDDLSNNPESRESRERFEQLLNEWYAEILREPSVQNAFKYLEKLPDNLVYHVKAHTEDVIRETLRFALEDNAPGDLVRQQAIAAAWHDVGFVKEKIGTDDGLYAEESSAIDMFRDTNPETGGTLGLSPEEVSETVGNLWDTRVLPEGGSLHLEMRNSHYGYMLDGDVSNFGREDFERRMKEVAKEKGIDLNNPTAAKGFYESVIGLLRNHSWKTESARRLREEKKQENLRWLEKEYIEILKKIG